MHSFRFVNRVFPLPPAQLCNHHIAVYRTSSSERFRINIGTSSSIGFRPFPIIFITFLLITSLLFYTHTSFLSLTEDLHGLSLPIPPAAHNRNNSLKIQFVSKFSRVSRLHFPNSSGRSLFPMPRRAKPLIKISTTRRISHLLINPPPAEPVEPSEPQESQNPQGLQKPLPRRLQIKIRRISHKTPA